ncbi:MAG TPA: tRNA (adenosine(37)-N6)-threonylcarbamoyltransferase complex dimerization subunit type 1 TsaB [Mucilaginibacter sp.]|nr:tRNA (adenosine(37)-N6)-threonylcarbamoyltransferase complex dimerization subunit type 1 TsaB [Mucilaginibacter sp.]
MSLILQIETATPVCSVALAKNGAVIAERSISGRNPHAEAITGFIDEIIAEAEIKIGDIDAVAVSCGPGSYTGLRIGISTAKGLCFALDKPLIAVETLEAMVGGVIARGSYQNDTELLFCPMIDARRMEVYTAVFAHDGSRVKTTSAEIIDENSFSEILHTQKMLFFGDGAEKCFNVLKGNLTARYLAEFKNDAADMSQIAARKFEASEFEDVAYFEPFYLKDFIAGKKQG